MYRHVMTILIVAIWMTILPATKARAEQNPFATVLAATQLANWFSNLLRPFEEIGQVAEKHYLINALTDLNRDLFELEQDKRYVIIALKRRPLVEAELKRASDSLTQRIKRLRKTLRTVAPKLRIAYRADSDVAINLLSEALITKKGFVYNLGAVTEATALGDIVAAENAVDALSSAQQRLADVISKLQAP